MGGTIADKVLIVDDDPSICKPLEKVMCSNNLETIVMDSGQVALYLLKDHAYDVILMDVVLGDMEGFEVIRALRSQSIKTLIIITSGRNKDHDSLYDLSIGADNYITEPFRPLVLGTKIEALIRHSRNPSSDSPDQLGYEPLSYSTSTMRFYKNGGEIFLSSEESSLMLLFMKHPGQAFIEEMIYEYVWGSIIAVGDNAITVYISRLRSKVEEDHQESAHITMARDLGCRSVL